MSSTADIADSATNVQAALTMAETKLTADGPLPDWYVSLRNEIHGLVTSAAWAVGETGGAAILGFRCEGRAHSTECVAYRAASVGWDSPNLTTCPKCNAQMHSLFEAGPTPYNCYPCWEEEHP